MMIPFKSPCPPNCSRRNAYCHSDCEDYEKAKAEHAERVAQVRAARKMAFDVRGTLAAGKARKCRWRHAQNKK